MEAGLALCRGKRIAMGNTWRWQNMEEGSVASSLFWGAKKAEWSIFAIKLRKVVAFFDLVVDNGIRDMFYSIIIILLKKCYHLSSHK